MSEAIKKYSRLAIFSFIIAMIPLLILFILFWTLLLTSGYYFSVDSYFTVLVWLLVLTGAFINSANHIYFMTIVLMLSLVLAVISLIKIKKYNLGGKCLAIISIVVSILELFFIFWLSNFISNLRF